MVIDHGCARYLALGNLLAGVMLAMCPCVSALDPTLDVGQYAHTAWKIREGFTKGQITSIAQAPNGYLWLGTYSGLYRFDGVRNVLWEPPPGQQLPSSGIWSLLAARDGTLWIGTDKGLASFKDGKVTHYGELAGIIIFTILEDRDGEVWAGEFGIPNGRLCAIHNGNTNGFWRWKPGPSKFYPMPGEEDSIHAFAEDDDGALLFSTRTGIKRLIDSNVEPYALPGRVQQFRFYRMLRDRNGALWLGTANHCVVHVHHGRIDVFAQSDGLSGDSITGLFEDREGNIWTVTPTGLDRFREFAVATVSVDQGLSSATVTSVLAEKDGSVLLGTVGGLDRWNDGRISIPRTGSTKLDGKLKGDPPNSLLEDSRGRIWVSTLHGFGYLEKDRFTFISGIPGEPVHGIAEDNAGDLWVAEHTSGLFRLSPRGEVQQIPWAGLGHNDFAYALIADPLQGGLWLGFFKGGVAYFSDGGIRKSYGVADGLGEGAVASFRFDPDGTLWVATQGGLSRLKNGRFLTLTSKNGLPCDTVHWVMEDLYHSFWLHMACGLVRVARSDIDAWVAKVDNDKETNPETRTTIRPTVFDISDGVMASAFADGYRPMVAKSSDGRLWSTGVDGAHVFDPKRIPFNKLPPPVHIEQIIADHKTYAATPDSNGRVSLATRVRDLQIDYTALSLVAPEKVLFRYKLEGWDRDWQNAGTRRQAFYSNLPPHNYRFRVMACNNSGVWNEAGAALDFFVAPAYYQTIWFRTSCVAAFLGLLFALHRLRLDQQARQFNMTLEARVSERSRIARDLHDTMLQDFQGVLLKFHALSFMLTDRTEAQQKLEGLVDEASQAITVGREVVRGMRDSTFITNNLAGSLTQVGERLVAERDGQNPVAFHVEVEGETQDLHPIIRDEVYRIASESVRNSFQHSGAARIEVDIHYGEREFRVRIRDNGKGIDPKILERGARVGHYGLPGMHERAKVVGGTLVAWSQLNSGTETELTIPASRAYTKSRTPRRFLFLRKGA